MDKKFHGVFLALGASFLFGLPMLSYAQRDTAEAIVGIGEASSLMTKASLPGVLDEDAHRGVKFSDFSAIRAFYEARGNMPLWTDDSNHVTGLVALLKDSWTQGLNPADYHVEEIDQITSGMVTPAQRARLELLLTDAVLRYGRDMTGMRVDPASIDQKAEYWRHPMKADEILQTVSASSNPVQAVAGMGPQSKLYRAMRQELIHLASQQADPQSEAKITFGGTMFKPGQHHKDVPALRARMNVAYNPARGPENLYDDDLSAAVMAFQKSHNLEPDGVIGPKTLVLLNRTVKDRVRQIVANMERIRWMEPKQPQRYIIVNIPSQMLWAVEDGKVAEEMPVVVGMPTRPTKSFKTEIIGVRFNPNWTVPMSIKMADMLPKLQQDPYALSDRGIDIIQAHAGTIDPGTVDWQNISKSEMRQFRMVQSPGEHNALGQIRVLMPNDYDIYLHDTNHRDLFVKDERLLSSGCVRLSEPRKIARFVLAHKEGWNDDKMERLLEKGRTADIAIEQKIPVYIVYQTMWFDGNGQLVYGSDVYGQDKKLLDVLTARKAFDLDKGVQTAQAAAPDAGARMAGGSSLLASVQ